MRVKREDETGRVLCMSEVCGMQLNGNSEPCPLLSQCKEVEIYNNKQYCKDSNCMNWLKKKQNHIDRLKAESANETENLLINFRNMEHECERCEAHKFHKYLEREGFKIIKF